MDSDKLPDVVEAIGRSEAWIVVAVNGADDEVRTIGDFVETVPARSVAALIGALRLAAQKLEDEARSDLRQQWRDRVRRN